MTVDLAHPLRGRWTVRHSPADRVPSHGTTRFASAHAIDLVPVDDRGRTGPVRPVTLVRPEPPARFIGFGRQVLAPADGLVVAAQDGAPDHHAYRGIPSLGYALTQRRRVTAGWTSLAGNHVMIATARGVVALCHLQQGSLAVRIGDRVRTGEPVGRCGNSGNSTEPHLHLQVVDRADVKHASAVPFTLEGRLPANGEVVDVPEVYGA